MLSEQVLARWWCLVAFMKATSLLYQAMHVAQYRCITVAIKTTSKVDTSCIIVALIDALAATGAIRSE